MNQGVSKLVGSLALAAAVVAVPAVAGAQSPSGSTSEESASEESTSEESASKESTSEESASKESSSNEGTATESDSDETGEASNSDTTATSDGGDTGSGSGAEKTSTEADGTEGESTGEKRVERTGERFGLRELLRRARRNKDLLDQYEAQRKHAEWRKFRADWAAAPKIRSTTTLAPVPARADPDNIGNNLDEIRALDIGPYVNQRLRIVVPVYTFGRIATARELAQVGIDFTEIKKRKAQLTAVFQTKRAYYTLRLTEKFGPLLRDGDRRIAKRLKEMENARAFGEAEFDTKDFRKLQIFGTRLDARISDNQKTRRTAESGLKLLADLKAKNLRVGELVTSGEVEPLADFETYFEAAKRHHPLLARVEKGLEARRLALRLEKRNYFPNVFVAGRLGAGWSTKSTRLTRVCTRSGNKGRCTRDSTSQDLWARPERTPFNRFNFGIALGVRWNIDPLGLHGKIKQKRAKLEELKAKKRRATDKVRIQVRRVYGNAADRRRDVRILRRRLDAARKWRNQEGLSLKAAGEDLDKLGKAIQPLKKFYKAKAKYFQMRYRYKVARARLAKTIGVMHLGAVEQTKDVEASPSEPTGSSNSGSGE